MDKSPETSALTLFIYSMYELLRRKKKLNSIISRVRCEERIRSVMKTDETGQQADQQYKQTGVTL